MRQAKSAFARGGSPEDLFGAAGGLPAELAPALEFAAGGGAVEALCLLKRHEVTLTKLEREGQTFLRRALAQSVSIPSAKVVRYRPHATKIATAPFGSHSMPAPGALRGQALLICYSCHLSRLDPL